MIPTDFEVNRSNVKVTVTVNMFIYGPKPVRMIITRHRIDLGSSKHKSWNVNDPYRF